MRVVLHHLLIYLQYQIIRLHILTIHITRAGLYKIGGILKSNKILKLV